MWLRGGIWKEDKKDRLGDGVGVGVERECGLGRLTLVLDSMGWMDWMLTMGALP